MADVSKIFKPRRGKVSTMLGTKASTVLAAGEMFFEVPDTGVGSGRGRIMMGDGSTTYVNLAGSNNNTGANSQAAKYFMPFTQDEVIVHSGTDTKSVSASSSIGSSQVATYLNNAKSGNPLKTIIHNLREAIYRNACDIALLNNEIGSSDTLEWKTLTHPAVNITTLTDGGNSVTVVSNNETVKNANEIYIHWNRNTRAGDILLVRTSTGETARGFSSFISYAESVNFNYIYCVGAAWNITEGTIGIGCIGNTWGLNNLPCGIAANSIRYR